jgi:methyl-accepting chemotaxis protein
MTVFGLKLPFLEKSDRTGPASVSSTAAAKGKAGGKRRLGDLQALVLIGVLFMVPIGLLLYDLFATENERIQFVEKETRGLALNAELRDLMQALLAHRAPARQVADGVTEARAEQQKLLATVKKDIAETGKAVERLGAEFGVEDEWKKAKADWDKLEAAMAAGKAKAEEVIAVHNLFYRELLVMVEEVAERSGLLLDSKLDISNISRTMTFTIPRLSIDLADLRQHGAEVIVAGKITEKDHVEIAFEEGQAKTRFEELKRSMAMVFEANSSIKQKLSEKFAKEIKDIEKFFATLDHEFQEKDIPAITAAAWRDEATQAVNDIFEFGDLLAPERKAQIEAELAELKRDQVVTLSIAVVFVLLAIAGLAYVGRGLLRSIRERAERAAADAETNRLNQGAILRLMDEMAPISDGKLTAQMTVDEQITGAIADSLNTTVGDLRKLVVGVTTTAGQVTEGAASAQKITQQLLAAAKKQAEEVERAGGSVELMTKSIGEVSSSATQSAASARKSLETTQRGAASVQSAVKSMNQIREQIQDTAKRIKRLGESSQEIGEIVEVISDITEQTNVLALNAAIQAASAGEAGRGFAVVAEEVQRLAERSADATKQIGALVKAIQTDTADAVSAMEKSTEGVVQGAQLSDAAGAALTEIELSTRDLAELVQSIATSTEMQVEIANEVAGSMKQTLALTGQSTEGVNQTAATVGQLAKQAEGLKGSVARFQVA